MATSRNSDVNLVIRARDEATRGIESVTASLNALFGQQTKTGNSAAELAAALVSIDKAASTVTAAADKGAAAFSRQEGALVKAKGDYVQIRVEADYAAKALANLQAAQSQIGPQQGGPAKLAEQIKLVSQESGRLENQAAKLQGQIKTLEAGVNAARSSLLQLSASERAAADGQAKVAATIELEAQALRERAAATEQVTEVQRRLNALTGVDRQATFTGETAKQSAGVLANADAIFREAEARDAAIKKLRQEEAAVTALAIAQERQEKFNRFAGVTADPRGKNAAASAAVFQQDDIDKAKANKEALDATTAAEKRLDAAAKELRADLNPLAEVQERFNQKIRDANELYAKGKISATELTTRTTQLGQSLKRATEDVKRGGAGGNSSIGLFGLRPYELTNLGYQVNDVATQLASGTSIGQTFAQQGGQILQLFPKISAGIVSAFTNPAVLAFAATIGVVAVALGRASDEAERLRGITAGLALNANGILYDPKEIEASAQALRGYGATIGDATAALKIFTTEGVNPDRLDAFGVAAQNLADVTGKKLPDVAQLLADGFTGGYEAVATLDDKLNVLSGTERKAIKDAFDSGDAARARTMAFDAFSRKLEEAAALQRGPGTEAARSLKKGYDDLLDSLAQLAPIQGAIDLFGKLGKAISQATGNAEIFTSGAARLARIAQLTKEINDLIEKDNNGTFFGSQVLLQKGIQAKQTELAQLQDQQRRAEADRAKQQSDTRAQGTAEQQKADIALGASTAKLVAEGAKRLAHETGITTQKQIQARLDAAATAARSEIDSSNPNASDGAKNAYVAQAVKNARIEIQDEIKTDRKSVV